MRALSNVVGSLTLALCLLSSQANAKSPTSLRDQMFGALLRAVDRDDVRAVRKLLRQGVDADGKRVGEEFEGEERPIVRAARRGNLEMVRAFLRAGAYPDWCCCSCVTALHVAIRQQQVAMVEMLIEAGASVRILCDGKDSPLELAKQTGNEAIVRLVRERLTLIEKGRRKGAARR